MNRPELEHTGAWPLIGLALAALARALAAWAWFATDGLNAHLGRVLPAHAVALLAVTCCHRARAAIGCGQEPASGAALARTALWLGYAALLTALPALGFVVFFLCCGVVG